MIVGDGMVAQALIDRPGVVFHAAGVSNSLCTDAEEFERDAALLRETGQKPGKLVYIGTVCAPGRPYRAHKRLLEAEVLKRPGSLVVRLPILGGRSENKHTLLNVIRDRIMDGQLLEVWGRAVRSVLDVKDAAAAIDWHLEQGHTGEVEIGAPWTYRVPDIVEAMERHLRKKARKVVVDVGEPVVAKPSQAPIKWAGLDEIIRRYYA